eukprot:Rmarinus@m.22766
MSAYPGSTTARAAHHVPTQPVVSPASACPVIPRVSEATIAPMSVSVLWGRTVAPSEPSAKIQWGHSRACCLLGMQMCRERSLTSMNVLNCPARTGFLASTRTARSSASARTARRLGILVPSAHTSAFGRMFVCSYKSPIVSPVPAPADLSRTELAAWTRTSVRRRGPVPPPGLYALIPWAALSARVQQGIAETAWRRVLTQTSARAAPTTAMPCMAGARTRKGASRALVQWGMAGLGPPAPTWMSVATRHTTAAHAPPAPTRTAALTVPARMLATWGTGLCVRTRTSVRLELSCALESLHASTPQGASRACSNAPLALLRWTTPASTWTSVVGVSTIARLMPCALTLRGVSAARATLGSKATALCARGWMNARHCLLAATRTRLVWTHAVASRAHA